MLFADAPCCCSLLLLLLQLTYQQGMAVVLVTALLILAASVIGLRGRLMQLFPSHLVFAMVVGLGLFLELVGWCSCCFCSRTCVLHCLKGFQVLNAHGTATADRQAWVWPEQFLWPPRCHARA
jgi:predicted benzoate:H+ symporter BenE